MRGLQSGTGMVAQVGVQLRQGWLRRLWSAFAVCALFAACGAPAEVTSACKVDNDCPNGFVCQSGVCTDPNQFSCNPGDNAYCEGLRLGGQWKTGDLSTCQSAACIAGTCQILAAPVSSICDDGDGLGCTQGACTEAAICTPGATIAADSCLIGGACVAVGGLKGSDAADACWQCNPTLSATDWSPRAAGSACPDDGVSCTVDACNASGQCAHATLTANTCRIGGACVTAGTLEPGNDCRTCAPDLATDSWSPTAKGSACPDDSVPCTLDICDGSGACKHDSLQVDTCLIGGSCVATGSLEPNNPCRSCQPSVAAKDWSPLPEGATCTSDGLACTIDACDGLGACKSDTLVADTCLVQSSGAPRCMAAGERDSDGNNCKACVPSVSTSQLSDATEGASCIAGVWCLTGQCAAGSCQSDGPKSGSCFLPGSGTCAEAGALNPQNACQRCEPGATALAWTSLEAGSACPADNIGCTLDVCDGAGGCQHPANDAECSSLTTQCATGSCDAGLGCISIAASVTKVCDSDGVPCVVDHCDGKGQCTPAGSGTADNGLCDDEIACTTDACTATGCTHTPVASVCDDGNVCTSDSCDLALDCTHVALSVLACDSDALPCTSQTCDNGSCGLAIDASSCVLADTCVDVGTTQAGGCQVCSPTDSQTAWTSVADQAPCETDDVACTHDVCSGASCVHTPDADLCDDDAACTADVCSPTSGCSNTDACPWGHTCNGSLDTCLSTDNKPSILSASGATDPNPTNATLGRHAAGNDVRTWAIWQSQSCMSVSSGKWVLSQGSRLRAMALDPQVAAPAAKVMPEIWTLPVSAHFADPTDVCQAWPTLAEDPQVPGQLWLSWLEAKPNDVSGCMSSNGQGGVLRVARLDAQAGPSFATISGACPGVTANGPLFLTQGFAVLAGTGDLTDPASREFVSVRPQGADLANWISGAALRGAGASAVSTSLNSLAPLASGSVQVARAAAAGSDEPLVAVGAMNDEGAWSLWAHGIKANGAKGTLAAWTSDTPLTNYFGASSAICGLDADVLADGTLGVAVVVRKGGNDEVVLLERTAAGVLSLTPLKSQTSLGDCRVGIAGVRIAAGVGGFAVTAYVTPLAITPFAASILSLGPKSVPVPALTGAAVSTTDNAAAGGPTFGLGWRGLTRPLGGTSGAVTFLQEALTTSESRQLLLFTGLPL